MSVEHTSWDEYDAVVVRAPDEDTALATARDSFSAYQWKKHSIVRVTEDGPTEIILDSYNAG